MHVRRRYSWTLGLALVVVALASSAAADTIDLQYSAPEGCPTEARFVARIAAHGGTFAPSGNGPILNVSLAHEAAGFSGVLRTGAAAGSSSPREVHGVTCEEVAEALSVVSALVLRTSGSKVETNTAPSVIATVPPSPRPATVVKTDDDRLANDGRLYAKGEVGKKSYDVAAGKLRFDPAFTLTAAGGVAAGIISNVLVPRTELSFTRANFVTLPDDSTLLFGTIARLRVVYYGPATARSGDSSTRVQGFAVGLGICATPLYDTRGLVVLFCSSFLAGVMQRDTTNAGVRAPANAIGIGTIGSNLTAQYNFGPWFHLAIDVGVDFLLNKLTTVRPDGGEIFHSTLLTGFGTIGAGIHF